MYDTYNLYKSNSTFRGVPMSSSDSATDNSFLNTDLIEKIRITRRMRQEDIAEKLDVSTKTYQRIVVKETESFKQHVLFFVKLSKLLDVDPIQLLSKEFNEKYLFSSVKVKRFSDEDEFNKFLLKLEKEEGRTAIFNSFPSTIYYRESASSHERYEYLSGSPEKNFEFYSICSVLSFCFNTSFNPFSYFTIEQKIEILSKIIRSFSRDEKDEKKSGDYLKQIHVFDPNIIEYFHDSPTCTFFRKIGLILIPSPTNRHELIAIRSIEFADKIYNYMKGSDGKVLQTKETVMLLKDLKSVLEKGYDASQFIQWIKENPNPNYADYVLNSLPKKLIKTN